MVAFWPWKGDSSSTASFEKTLSTLSTKITETQASLDKVRASSRRAKVLWTLYLSFAYLVYAIVLLLVVGYKNLGAYEWTGLAGGPVLIYVTRTVLTSFYNFRIDSLSARLKDQQQERTNTIQKLKDATKYDSTMELIEKYGGADGKPKGKKDSQEGDGQDAKNKTGGPSTGPQGGRTRMPPPATANIQRRPGTPQPPNPLEPGAEFAPNADFTPTAFTQPPPPPPPSHYNGPAESHWYDRIFDVLLGEDETAPKNRIVLICKSCRLVNGQAPPGTKTLSDVGVWRCMSCNAMNGELDEGKRIVNEVLAAAEENQEDQEDEQETGEDGSSDAVEVSKEEVAEMDGPAASVRKRRGKGKK
ncbi:Fc.00g035250.m01.CDS01 [Cosmosporella sp. VM-42]